MTKIDDTQEENASVDDYFCQTYNCAMQHMEFHDMAKKVRSVGRPSKPEGVKLGQIAVRLPQHLLDGLDEIQASRADSPVRSQMIREAVADYVAARLKRK